MWPVHQRGQFRRVDDATGKRKRSCRSKIVVRVELKTIYWHKHASDMKRIGSPAPIAVAISATLLGLLLVGLANTQPQQASTRASSRPTNSSSQAPARLAKKNERSLSAAANNSSPLDGRLDGSFVEDELPPDFYEMPPEQLDLGMNATGQAPVPILNVAVLQNGQVIDNAVTVHPGTPLEMVIYLDDKSAKVYGLLASYLKVKDDTFRQREETIIQNGCSIDTYIFGNFEHQPEDQSLRAKFRAFKFPESNFVRFIGTVNVCIKQCAKVNCGNGGLQRRRRSSPANNSNGRLVQLTVSTVLRIGNTQSK